MGGRQIRSATALPLNDDEMKELFDQADLNGDGALTDRECNGFCDAIRMFHGLRSPLSEEFYAIVLDELDPEETGRIYLDDLQELYQAVWDERRTGVLNPDAPLPTIGDEEEAAGRRALEALTAELPPPTPITHRHVVEGSSRKSSGEMGNEVEREHGEEGLGVEKEEEMVVEEAVKGTVVREEEKGIVVEEKEAVMVVNNGNELVCEEMREGQTMGEQGDEKGERKLEPEEEEGMTVVAREEEVAVEEQGEMIVVMDGEVPVLEGLEEGRQEVALPQADAESASAEEEASPIYGDAIIQDDSCKSKSTPIVRSAACDKPFKIIGNVPTSFFTSPYNTHPWIFGNYEQPLPPPAYTSYQLIWQIKQTQPRCVSSKP